MLVCVCAHAACCIRLLLYFSCGCGSVRRAADPRPPAAGELTPAGAGEEGETGSAVEGRRGGGAHPVGGEREAAGETGEDPAGRYVAAPGGGRVNHPRRFNVSPSHVLFFNIWLVECP